MSLIQVCAECSMLFRNFLISCNSFSSIDLLRGDRCMELFGSEYLKDEVLEWQRDLSQYMCCTSYSLSGARSSQSSRYMCTLIPCEREDKLLPHS